MARRSRVLEVFKQHACPLRRLGLFPGGQTSDRSRPGLSETHRGPGASVRTTPAPCVRTVYAAGLSVLALVTVGCGAGSVYSWTVHTTSTPIAATLQPERLHHETTAIFTPFASGGLRGSEAGLGQSLANVIRKAVPSWNVMEERQVISLLNRHGLAADYTRMRSDAEQSGILDVALLRTIAHALGARYAFQPRLAFFSQDMTDRFTFPALNIRFSHTRSSLLRLSLQLWDTESGELLWASVAEAALESEGMSQEPVLLEAAAGVALGSMVEDFLSRRTQSRYTSLNKSLDLLTHPPIPVTEANQEQE